MRPLAVLVGIVSSLLGCAGGVPTAAELGSPPDGVEALRLEYRYRPGMIVRTHRVLTSTEPVAAGTPLPDLPSAERYADDAISGSAEGDAAAGASAAEANPGGVVQLMREDIYRTQIEQVDAYGQPVSALRTYDRALIGITRPDGEHVAASAISQQTIAFRAGQRPMLLASETADAEPVDPSLIKGLSLTSFDALFVPSAPVWPGATWRIADAELAPLDRFLRDLGLLPRTNDVTVTFAHLTDEGDAVLEIEWIAAGLLANPGGTAISARMTLRGAARFSRAHGLITALDLRGNATGRNALVRITINREVLSAEENARRQPLPSTPGDAPNPAEPLPPDESPLGMLGDGAPASE